jgi:adenosine/AMP kinase
LILSGRGEDNKELKTVPIETPAQLNFILGHSHFIKTSKGIEGEEDIAKRKSFLRAIGYKQ